jgi:hypothetical protein
MIKTKAKRPPRYKARKPPGHVHLVHFGVEANTPHGEKCSCVPDEKRASGRWLVLYSGNLYGIEPNTQLEKDSWLQSAKCTISEETAIAMLRWWCFSCRTVQTP